MNELITIMANLALAVQIGELTDDEAEELLDAFCEHRDEVEMEADEMAFYTEWLV